jgi:hypothetical protein
MVTEWLFGGLGLVLADEAFDLTEKPKVHLARHNRDDWRGQFNITHTTLEAGKTRMERHEKSRHRPLVGEAAAQS